MCIAHCCKISFNCWVGESLISQKHIKIAQQFLRDWKRVTDCIFDAEIMEVLHAGTVCVVRRLGQALLEEELNRPLQVAESQSWSGANSASTSWVGMGWGSWSAPGTWDRKEAKSFRDNALARPFSAPGRWTQLRPNPNLASIKKRHRSRCIMSVLQLHRAARAPVSAWLSQRHRTDSYLNSAPHRYS